MIGYCALCGGTHELSSSSGCPRALCTPTWQREWQPFKCPVCNGTGLVSFPPGQAGDVPTFVSSDTGPWACPPCSGTGIVWKELS